MFNYYIYRGFQEKQEFRTTDSRKLVAGTDVH